MATDRKQNLLEAAHEAKTNKLLGPGHFFLPCKTTLSVTAYREAEVFNIEALIEYIHAWQQKAKETLAISVQGKYDGNSCYLQRDLHGNFYVFTEDGSEATARFPHLVNYAKTNFPQVCYILIGEVEKWVLIDGVSTHQGREVVAGELHSTNTSPQDEHYVWNMHDCVWYDGVDIHNQNYSDRYSLLEKKFPFKYSLLTRMKPGSFNLVPNFICKTDEDIKNAIGKLIPIAPLEGAMVKWWNGFPYELDGRTNQECKYKKYAEAHLVVIGKRLIGGSTQTFQYDVAVEVLPSEMDEVDQKFVAKFQDMSVMQVAQTFNTNVAAAIGDILTVKFHNLFVHKNDEGKYKLDIYEPRVYENRTVANPKEAPDTVTTLMKTGMDAQMLAFKGFTDADLIPFELVKQIDLFSQFPDENQVHQFIIHHHWRGMTTHGDLRIEHMGNKVLLGYTLNIMNDNVVKKPVLTIEDAKAWAFKPELWKFNVETGKFQTRQTHSGVKKATSILVELKEPEPIEWLSFTGVVPPGNVGSTKQYPGVFYIACKGTADYGFRNGYFQEYWMHVENWDNGGQRLLFRQLSSNLQSSLPISKFLQWAFDVDEPVEAFLVCSDFISCKHGEVQIPEDATIEDETISFKDTILPPSEGATIRTPTMWLLIKPNDDLPYVLSTRAVQKGRITPYGASGLPKNIRNQIPGSFHYWIVKDIPTRIKVRDGLVTAIKHHEVKVDWATIYKGKSLIDETLLKTTVERKFVLNRRTWRGPIHVRIGYSAELYDLWIDDGSDAYLFTFNSNPILFQSATGTSEKIKNKKLMNALGTLAPGTDLNPNKAIPVTIDRVTEGEILLLIDESSLKKFQVKTKEWKGLYLLTQDENTNIWTIQETGNVGEAG